MLSTRVLISYFLAETSWLSCDFNRRAKCKPSRTGQSAGREDAKFFMGRCFQGTTFWKINLEPRFQALVTTHHLMCYGNERFLQSCASRLCLFSLQDFQNKPFEASVRIKISKKYSDFDRFVFQKPGFSVFSGVWNVGLYKAIFTVFEREKRFVPLGGLWFHAIEKKGRIIPSPLQKVSFYRLSVFLQKLS